jgi:hypothetical protein
MSSLSLSPACMQSKQVHYGSHVIRLANMEMCGKAVTHQLGVSHYTDVSTLRGAYSFQIATGRFYHIYHSASLLWRHVFSTMPRCC